MHIFTTQAILTNVTRSVKEAVFSSRPLRLRGSKVPVPAIPGLELMIRGK